MEIFLGHMMLVCWIVLGIVISQGCSHVHANYHCTMSSLEVFCTGIAAEEVASSLIVTISKPDIVTLNITNGIIPVVSPILFENFTNLQSLYVKNSQVSKVEIDAFSDLKDLQDLSLSGNFLKRFDWTSLPTESQLKTLDLSFNRLDDFSDFNISSFPRLNALNLANNFLSYLPVGLLEKVKAQNEFYLLAGNNPWNCSNPNWIEHLTDELVNAFCTNKTFSYKKQDHVLIESKVENRENKTEQEQCEKPNCLKCSFYYCWVWLTCGIWFGIILGNLGKIRSLICVTPVTYTDVETQCDYSLVEQHMISRVFKASTQKSTTANASSISGKEK